MGTRYVFRVENEEECTEWVEALNKAVQSVRLRLERAQLGSWQAKAKKLLVPMHESKAFQVIMVLLISTNFVVNLAEAQFLPPPGSREATIYWILDIVFTALFTIELCINLYVNWWREFVSNGWSVFDLVVVASSLIATAASVNKTVPRPLLLSTSRRLYLWTLSLRRGRSS